MHIHRQFASGAIALGLVVASGAAATAAPHSLGLDKPLHVFDYARIVRVGQGGLSFRARVDSYPNQTIDLMKKLCKTCAWSQVQVHTTDGEGRVASVITAPATGRWYWRYRTPASPGFAVSYSSTWFTFDH